MTLLGALVIAAIQIGTGVDANVSFLVVRDAIVNSLIGAALAIPVLLGVRLVVRSALVDERQAVRRPTGAPRAVETPSQSCIGAHPNPSPSGGPPRWLCGSRS